MPLSYHQILPPVTETHLTTQLSQKAAPQGYINCVKKLVNFYRSIAQRVGVTRLSPERQIPDTNVSQNNKQLRRNRY